MNRDELLNELQEQARLVGMGAERELALKAQVQRLERVNAELLEALEWIADRCPEFFIKDAFSTMVHLHSAYDAGACARAAIAKARGEA